MRSLLRRLQFEYWYHGQPRWDTGISPPELLEFIQVHPPGRAIDIGCGTGTNVITLARAGWRVTGIDFAPRAIWLAGQKIEAAGVSAGLIVEDATRLRHVNGPFDLALDIGCFHGLPQDGQSKYLSQLDRILAPRGFWLMYGFFRPETEHAQTGLVEADLDRIPTHWSLVSRRDGRDDKRERPSAWFQFQKTGQAAW